MPVDPEYKERIMKFSKKIDDWYLDLSLKKKGTFKNDEEFEDVPKSPSRFNSSLEDNSSESESFERLLDRGQSEREDLLEGSLIEFAPKTRLTKSPSPKGGKGKHTRH